MKRVFWSIFFLWLVIFGMLFHIFLLRDKVKKLENRPAIIYHPDSYGGQTGKIMAKGKDGDHYFVEIRGYGRFLVSEEQYDVIVVGEEAPREIFERGS